MLIKIQHFFLSCIIVIQVYASKCPSYIINIISIQHWSKFHPWLLNENWWLCFEAMIIFCFIYVFNAPMFFMKLALLCYLLNVPFVFSFNANIETFSGYFCYISLALIMSSFPQTPCVCCICLSVYAITNYSYFHWHVIWSNNVCNYKIN